MEARRMKTTVNSHVYFIHFPYNSNLILLPALLLSSSLSHCFHFEYKLLSFSGLMSSVCARCVHEILSLGFFFAASSVALLLAIVCVLRCVNRSIQNGHSYTTKRRHQHRKVERWKQEKYCRRHSTLQRLEMRDKKDPKH